MSCEDEFAVQPLITGSFIEGTAIQTVVVEIADLLFDKQVTIQIIQEQVGSLTYKDVTAYIADLRRLDGRLARRM
jgi:hypothetical protein